MAEGLAKRGHSVTLEIPHEGPALEAANALEGVEVWLSGRPRLPRGMGEAAAYLLGLPGALRSLRRRIRADAYDLVWVNSMFNPPAALAARLAGVPVVWHLHERNLRGPASLPMAWLIRLSAQIAVPVSGFVAGTFSRIPGGAGRQEVLFEQFPRLPELPPAPEGDELVLGFVGQLEPRKRVRDLLHALAEVPRVRGLIVGDGKRRHEVPLLIERLGLQDRVEWAGLQREVVPYYGRMHGVVIPSRDEPCPLVAFEAMSVGRPVIASEHGGHPEVLGDAALYFPLGDVQALAAQIRRLRDDPELRSKLARSGMDRVRRFNREDWLDDVERIARAAVNGTGGGQ